MLLTVFYIAATWMQAWRLGSIKRKIAHFATQRTSVVFYKVPVRDFVYGSGGEIPSVSASSNFCANMDKAMVGDLLYFSSSIRACTLIPEQVVNVNNWIGFVNEDATFPFEVPSRRLTLNDPKLFLLVEANCLDTPLLEMILCKLTDVGIPKAWRAQESFGVIMESDMDHLTELALLFMTSSARLDDGMELCRIQTITVEGRPCLVINTDRIAVPRSPLKALDLNTLEVAGSEWPRRSSVHMSPLQWQSHVELLRSFSRCAHEAVGGTPVAVPEHRMATVTAGNKALVLDSPVVIDMPEKESEGRRGEVTPEAKVKTPTIVTEASTEAEASNSAGGEKKRPVSPRQATVATVATVASVEAGPRGARGSRGSLGGILSSCEPTPQTSRCGSAAVSAQSTPSKYCFQRNTFSSLHSLGSASTLSIRSLGKAKPPNVLVYSESPATTDNVKSVLGDTLHRHKYTIYSVTGSQLASSNWTANCSLLVLCGNVPDSVSAALVSYLLQGGRLLCLCSAFLHTLLPTFRTAEVRERELVRFTYGRWSRVRLMHHVFCYQNSPARTKFSREADEPPSEKDRISPVPQTPASVQVLDTEGTAHTLHVQVLGAEETWQTPSLLLAYFPSPGGRAVFSQVHLELDPSECLEEREGEALRHSDLARKEIIRDLLSTHLGLECGGSSAPAPFTVAYFLGRHELKLEFLEKVKHRKQEDGLLRLADISLKFCGKGEAPPPATATLLPVLVHSCPRDFSTLEYFENLDTEALGRLLLYCEVIGSSMDVVNGELAHGLAVVPSLQTTGKGRSWNQWLSPPGCAMFSLQLHLPTDSYLGRHPSILQQVTAVAVVASLAELSPQYSQAFDLRLKWPNDIYTGDTVKVGGIIATCTMSETRVICNIGCAMNLDNDSPTTCLNSLIKEYNKTYNQKLSKITREKLLAKAFTHLERIVDRMQGGDVQYLHDLYYQFWLHSGAQVNVVDGTGAAVAVTIAGIDEYGFLKVREQTGRVLTVHPDGNTFDMMEGLIVPKLY